MSDAWLAGTRPLVTPGAEPAVVIIIDGDDLTGVTDAASAVVNGGVPVEVRASFAGPARGGGAAAADVAVIVQQVALAAAGGGLWAAVELVVSKAFRRHPAEPAAQPEQDTGSQPPAQSLTVVIPTRQGPALIRRVAVGPQDLDEGQLSVERIARALAQDSDTLPQV